MNPSKSLLVACHALVLAGCVAGTTPPGQREPRVKPSLVRLTPELARQQGDVAGTASGSGTSRRFDAGSVSTPDAIEAFPIGRTVDPADPDLMHERHVVYRRAKAPQWKLEGTVDAEVLVGPRLTDGRQELQPLLTKELTTFLGDQRRATESNQKAISALFQAVDALARQQQELASRLPGREPKSETSPERQVPKTQSPPTDGEGVQERNPP